MEYMIGFFIASTFWVMALNPMHWDNTSPLSILLFAAGIATLLYEAFIKSK